MTWLRRWMAMFLVAAKRRAQPGHKVIFVDFQDLMLRTHVGNLTPEALEQFIHGA